MLDLDVFRKCKCLFFVSEEVTEVFCEKGVLRNFAKFTGKYLFQSLIFHRFTGLAPSTLLKKTLEQVFPVN